MPKLLQDMEKKNFIKIMPLYKKRMKKEGKEIKPDDEDKDTEDDFEKFDEMEEEIKN
jgi:hypothetical protein